jgi:hypothetical protein
VPGTERSHRPNSHPKRCPAAARFALAAAGGWNWPNWVSLRPCRCPTGLRPVCLQPGATSKGKGFHVAFAESTELNGTGLSGVETRDTNRTPQMRRRGSTPQHKCSPSRSSEQGRVYCMRNDHVRFGVGAARLLAAGGCDARMGCGLHVKKDWQTSRRRPSIHCPVCISSSSTPPSSIATQARAAQGKAHRVRPAPKPRCGQLNAD